MMDYLHALPNFVGVGQDLNLTVSRLDIDDEVSTNDNEQSSSVQNIHINREVEQEQSETIVQENVDKSGDQIRVRFRHPLPSTDSV